MTRSHPSLLKSIQLAAATIVLATLGVALIANGKTSTDVRSRAANPVIVDSAVCPSPPAFTGTQPIAAYQFTYPAIIRSADNTSWRMFTGGIASRMPLSIRQQDQRSLIRFPDSQEEIWMSTSKDLANWSLPKFSFRMLPETQIAFQQNKLYKDIYPNSFSGKCTQLGNSLCNVQINDPSVVRYNGSLYLYFTMLENYRWYDGTYGVLGSSGPQNPTEQNRHSIGLAVSGDDGKNWAFVGKIIPEHPTDSDGKSVLGAWAPSAIVIGDRVDVYFHDALGTQQYVAQLKGGVSIQKLERLNKSDSVYRVNMDIIRSGNLFEATFNDASFNIVRTYFSGPQDFGKLCNTKIIVPADATHKWPTPHQVIDGDKVHLFFWQLENPSSIHHWVRAR